MSFRHRRSRHSRNHAPADLLFLPTPHQAVWHPHSTRNSGRVGAHQSQCSFSSQLLVVVLTFYVSIQHDDQKVKDYGVSLSVRLIKRLVNEGGVTGFHFSTLNLEKSVQRILEGLDWAHKGPSKFQNWLIAVRYSSFFPSSRSLTVDGSVAHRKHQVPSSTLLSRNRSSSSLPPTRVITPPLASIRISPRKEKSERERSTTLRRGTSSLMAGLVT